jgi:hypothetical protein
MTEKDKVSETKVKWNGLFDFKEVYQFAYRWLDEEDYFVEERKYSEEVSGEAKKIEISWVALKRVSDYFRYEQKLAWRIIGMTTVEVEKNGKKVKMNKGSFEIKITSTLIKDWASTWETSPFMKFLRGVYDRFIVEGRIRNYELKCFKDGEDMAEQIKAFLTIEGMKFG